MAGLLALPGAALGWEAWMDEDSRQGHVFYETGAEYNDVADHSGVVHDGEDH